MNGPKTCRGCSFERYAQDVTIILLNQNTYKYTTPKYEVPSPDLEAVVLVRGNTLALGRVLGSGGQSDTREGIQGAVRLVARDTLHTVQRLVHHTAAALQRGQNVVALLCVGRTEAQKMRPDSFFFSRRRERTIGHQDDPLISTSTEAGLVFTLGGSSDNPRGTYLLEGLVRGFSRLGRVDHDARRELPDGVGAQ